MGTGFGRGFDALGTPFDFMFTLVPVFMIAIFLVVVVGITFTVVSGIKRWHQNNNAPVEQFAVHVVAKRIRVSHARHGEHTSSGTSYYVTFEFPDGGRREFSVAESRYGIIAEGDAGMLRFQGTRFLEFSRH